MQRRICTLALFAATTATAVATPTVTLSIASSDADGIIAPGAAITWTISFAVSAGDNDGLALLSTDLMQNPANPVLFDLAPAAAVPAGMTNFARPAGVSNPGTGYRGTQAGTAGQRNLLQIGGSQNTFGVAMSAGAGVGESASVVGGVGQSGSAVLASGSMTMPSACGTYSYDLANAFATVVVDLQSPPNVTPVQRATPGLASGTMTLRVALTGDVNLDDDVNLTDLSVLLAHFGQGSGQARSNGDLDGDGDVDLSDLSMLLANFGISC